MKHKGVAPTSAATTTCRKLVILLITVCLTLSGLNGCDGAPSSQAEIRPARAETATLIHRADGPDLLAVANLQAEAGPLAEVRQVRLPGILEGTGQVTFDDKLVSTIISRLTGRIENIRTSQWETVHRGELVMSLYSPDYMSAEAEYLAAIRDSDQNVSSGTGAFGIPASVSMAASLKEAAIRKLELLGFSASEIARIRSASPSVWVRAPINGIIVSKNVVRGQQVNPGDQLFALATLQRVWITADIYQEQLAQVRVGQSLEAVTASYPGEVFNGTVERISPSLDPNTHTLQLRCEVINRNSLLKPQMLARVRLTTSPSIALIIPDSALVFDDKAYYVFVLAGGNKVERRQVKIAEWSEDDYTRVTSGIGPSDRFLTTESLRFNALWHVANGEAP